MTHALVMKWTHFTVHAVVMKFTPAMVLTPSSKGVLCILAAFKFDHGKEAAWTFAAPFLPNEMSLLARFALRFPWLTIYPP